MPRSRRTSDTFFAPAPAKTIDVGHDLVDIPIRYYRTDAFLGLFSADLDAVRDLLPSSRLQPVRLKKGRAAIGIMSYNYIETGVGPYGEIGIAAMCTLDRAAPPVLPLLREAADPSFGAFVLHLPVTSRIARDAGRTVWGYPKFTADMAFDFRPETQQVTLVEGGAEILQVAVRRRGRVRSDAKPLVTLSENDGALIRTVVATRATVQLGVGRGQGHLELGDHPIAEGLRALDISSEAAATKSYLSHAAILPAGASVGPTDRPYDGFAGSEATFGRHTIRYDDGVERVITEATPQADAEPADVPLAVG